MTIVYPAIASLFYTFGLPWVQYKIDIKKFRLVDAKRIKEKHRADRYVYLSQKRTSKAKAESNPEYWKEKLSRDLVTWDLDRSNLQSELDLTRETRDSLQQQVNSSNSIQTNLSKEIERVRKQHHDDKQSFMQSESSFSGQMNEAYGTIDNLQKEISDLKEKLSHTELLKNQINSMEDSIDKYRSLLEETNERFIESQNSVGNMLLVFDTLNDSFRSSEIYEQLRSVSSNTKVEQAVIASIRTFIEQSIEPVREIVEAEREPIDKAKRKHELALEQQKTQQQLDTVQKSLADLDKDSNKAINMWD
ncbi:hypothetical protein GCM10007932_17250 [Vibrio penaeicida]|uniref:Uncharacterized protein n=2 Tax=Vibrio penaeicida TaxID=104609 RepID=A0AAV5NPJ3_9VIBR|nr:hypothetical protein GCM10007932_17250 [Vibrio penaeicida]